MKAGVRDIKKIVAVLEAGHQTVEEAAVAALEAAWELYEEWRDVDGWEGYYQVSSLGRVRSVTRVIIRSDGHRRTVVGVILKTSLHRFGYPQVRLWRNRHAHPRTVHRLVARAFLGPRPDGLNVCHLDGDPANNSIENLRYDTQSNNNLDAVRHGTHGSSRKTHCPSGHPYDETNTASGKRANGRRARYCRTCNNKRGAK